MLRITVSKTGEVPRTHAFDKREITVGRTSVNDLVIPEPGVSSAHARILFTGRDVTLVDLESTNGTFVNGARIQGPHILGPRDEVHICSHRLEFDLGVGSNLGTNQGASLATGSGPAPMAPQRPYAESQPGYPAPAGPPSMPPPLHAAPHPPMGAPPPIAAPASAPPPPMGPPAMEPAFANAGGFAGMPNLGVPSAVGVGGPLPRRPDEPPTMPPPLGPIDPPAAMDLPPSMAPPPMDLAPPPMAPPPMAPPPMAPPPMAPPPMDVAPPPIAPVSAPPPIEPPARTGATFTPTGGGMPDAAPPLLEVPASIVDTREPAASLEPVPHAAAGYPSIPEPAAPSGWSTPAPAAPPSFAPAPEPPPPSMPPPPALDVAPLAPVINEPATPSIDPVTPRSQPAPSQPEPAARAPMRSSPSRPPIVPQVVPASSGPVVRSSPSGSPVFLDPRHVDTADVDFTDLAALSGPALARAACARVFASVFELLTEDSELPARDGEARARARAEAVRLLQIAAETASGIEVRPWAERIASELCGLGALSARLAETDVQEIFVHGPDRVLVRRGNAVPAEIDAKFSCPQAIEVVVRRLTGTNFGAENPIVDARTLDGADVYAVHESVASGGPVVNITLPSPTEPRWTLERLLQEGALSPAVANLLSVCVQAGLGILVCAGPGARAFPLVSALVDAAPATDRAVLVRPMSEPGLLPPHVVILEGDGLVGTDGTTVMQALVRTAVGLRPDRLCLHETTGPEASDLMAAAGRGLAGVLVSMRASTADAGIHRLAALTGLAGGPDHASRVQAVARTLELVVTIGRFPDGHSRVVEVAEARVGADGSTTTAEIIGIDPRTGTWRHTGAVPNFFASMQRRGIVVDAAMLGG